MDPLVHVTLYVATPFGTRGVAYVHCAIPVALATNVLRITVTGILFETVADHRVAMIVYHDLAGWLMMPLALVLMWLELKIFSRLFVELPAEGPESIRFDVGLAPRA